MSIIYLNSCGDSYATAQLSKRWSVVTGSPVVTSLAGRRLGQAITLPTTSDRLQQNVPALATYICGKAFKLDTIVATDLITFRETATDHVIVRVTATGAIEVLRAPSTQLGISLAGIVFAGFYSYIEALCTVDGAAGVVTVNLNGTQILNLTSQDTDNAGAVPEINNIEIEGSTGNLSIDDFYINDTTGAAPQNGIMGDTRIESQAPIADGVTNDFPGVFPASPTTHFDKVDDITPDDDSTYVFSGDVADIELFDMETLPDPEGTSAIFGVQLLNYARKDKVTAKSIIPKVRSGGSNFNGTTVPLTTSYLYYPFIWQQDPNTAADWTEANVNAAEFGLEIA